MRKFIPKYVVIEEGLRLPNFILSRLNTFRNIEYINKNQLGAILQNASDILSEGKKILYFKENKGRFFSKCPGTRGLICCNYKVLEWANNCPFDCSYCILQGYLSNPAIVVYTNIEDMLKELKIILTSKVRMRIGTGEYCDSIVLDHLLGYNKILVELFREQSSAFLELKTKSNNIEELINLDHNRKTIVSWSLNPQKYIDTDEKFTSSLNERIEAAYILSKKGYWVAFHFDPIIADEESISLYKEVIKKLSKIPSENIAYISMGTFRLPKFMKEKILMRFYDSIIFNSEFILEKDNKLRYPKKIRIPLYKEIYKSIREITDAPVYLCMESSEVWYEVFGFYPSCNFEVDRMLKDRLFK